jgi:hypothetical protein
MEFDFLGSSYAGLLGLELTLNSRDTTVGLPHLENVLLW